MRNLIFSPAVLTSTLVDNTAAIQGLNGAMVIFGILLGILFLMALVLEIMRMRADHFTKKRLLRFLTLPVYAVAAVVLVFIVLFSNRISLLENAQLQNPPDGSSSSSTSSTVSTAPTSGVTVPTGPSFLSKPQKTDQSNPQNWNIDWDIIANNTIVSNYQRPQNIHFGLEDKYFQLPGISGFRGGNYRTGATYGSVNVVDKKLTKVWDRDISEFPKGSSGVWTGAGWTGQPLLVQWDEETKAIMNLYPEKKAKAGLVEVIYATLDGNIYFYDLETGEYTRDPLYMGMTFKGSGALDPRGYPIMYVGSGDRAKQEDGTKKEPRMFIINLIDCTVMYEHGYEKDFNFRSWRAFDASPLVHAATDTLIWPGENGVIYTIKLNTSYNKSAGTISIKPDAPVMTRYMSDLNKDDYSNNLGFESSPIIVENYLYVGDNRGLYFCVDLNTMELVWAQEIKDDLNATAVFEWGDDGQGYLYLGTSMEYGNGVSHMYKLNATTGQIIWETKQDGIYYDKNVSGGALSSPLLGKKGTELEGMIFFHIAKTPSEYEGMLLAMDTNTGRVLWRKIMKYCWSSPVAVYSDDGKAYVILFDSVGNAHLMDGKTGNVLDTVNVGYNVEASPAIFNDMLVIGTRGKKVFGIKIS